MRGATQRKCRGLGDIKEIVGDIREIQGRFERDAGDADERHSTMGHKTPWRYSEMRMGCVGDTGAYSRYTAWIAVMTQNLHCNVM